MSGGETSLSGYDNASQSLSYTPGQEQVYLNGILLVRGDDYTATNGTSITGLSALAASDFVQINCYNNFSVATTPATSITGTIANNQLANSAITINGTSTSLGGTYTNAAGSTSAAGILQLTDSTSSTSTSTAATPNSVKSAYDLANGAIPKTLTTTTGDIIYASGAKTPARLGIGSTDQILKVSGGVPTWAAASSGGMTLLSTTTTNSGSTIRIQSIDQNYKQLYILIKGVRRASTGLLRLYANNTQSGGYFLQGGVAASTVYSSNSQLGINLAQETTTRWASTESQVTVIIDGYATSDYKTFFGYGQVGDGGGPQTQVGFWGGVYSPKTAFTELNLKFDTAGDFTAGTVEVYGVK
jgi:hypothetical protein